MNVKRDSDGCRREMRVGGRGKKTEPTAHKSKSNREQIKSIRKFGVKMYYRKAHMH